MKKGIFESVINFTRAKKENRNKIHFTTTFFGKNLQEAKITPFKM